MAIYKIDSNFTGLAFAEELTLGTLPGSPTWYDVEPNEYKDFGGELSTVARSPIDPSRQNKKGTITDLDASGGYGVDLTKTNMLRLFQGFFFADARETKTTKPLNGVQVVITGINGAGVLAAASGLNVFATGEIVKVSGFATAVNNGVTTVTSSTSTSLTTALASSVESGTSAVVVEKVGVKFASGDAQIVKTGNLVSLQLTTGVFTGMDGVAPGAWVFIGGDTGTSKFNVNPGYARIATVSAKVITFDQLQNDIAASEVGTGKSIEMYVGMIIKNEKLPANIKTRSYNLERSLGTSDIGVQAEYLKGAVPNELTLNTPTADKVTLDLSFTATGYYVRSGAGGDEKETGTHIPGLGEEAFNTSSNIPMVALTTYDATRSKQTPLFAYCEGFNMSSNNNVTVNKAVGVLGGFDVSVGQFDVSASTDAYFADVNALKAIRNNADVGANIILAQKNYGIIFDIPLGSVSGGQLDIEKNTSVKTTIEFTGAENRFGYTMQVQSFPYLPTLAMVQA
jgi:hypothetical protein